MVRTSILTSITACALILCIVLLQVSLYLYAKLEDTNSRLTVLQELLSEHTVSARILINYGNGTRKWLNDTVASQGSNLLNLTSEIADVEVTISSYGASVTAISGVGSKFTKPGYYWLWWRWVPEKTDWELASMGADQYIVKSGDILAWNYEDTSSWPNLEKP